MSSPPPHTESVPAAEAAPPPPAPRPYAPEDPFTPPVISAEPAWTRDRLVELYWQFHPRFRFLKFMPLPGAAVLDLGCGGGGLAAWKSWLEPDRSDLRFFGVDLGDNPRKALYAGFALCNVEEEDLPWQEERFGAVMASHVFEHLKDPERVLGRLAARLAPDARLYVEVPSPSSTRLPTAEAFRNAGWPMIISNFHDDCTHLRTYDAQELAGMAERQGLEVVAGGVIENRLLADPLIDFGLKHNDGEMLLYGYWLATGWAHFIELRRRGA